MSRRNRSIIIVFVLVTLLVVVGYVGAGVYIYNRLSSVQPACANLPAAQTDNMPSAFNAFSVDTTLFQMPNFEAVSFPSRSDNFNLSGWYVPAENATADTPAVILVHGLNGCKRSSAILLPAGMLHRAGFHVLMLDLRDHGDSAIEDGRFAGGTEEYRDVLGAWDWLVNDQGIAPEHIGLFGTSLGAASVLNAMADEPRIAAAWEDSSFADLRVALEDFLTYNGFPTFFAPAAPFVGRIISGDDITSPSPLSSISQINGRPLFIVHGDADRLMPVKHAYALAAVVGVEPWIAVGSAHVGAMFDYTDEYQQRLTNFFNQYLR